MPGVLDARDRNTALRKLTAGPLDVLVIGGGITGAGAALDAVSRGLRVGLIEGRDLAAGTSSRSSKLIHGGLRYLEQRDFKLVREALRERDLLVTRLAPHLVKPVPFLYPLYRKVVERPYVGAGLVIYDAMEGTKRPVPYHRHLTARGALRRAPALRPERLAGAMVYYDAQVDDARHTLTVARTAAAHGAIVLTRATATSLLRSDDGPAAPGGRPAAAPDTTGSAAPGGGPPDTTGSAAPRGRPPEITAGRVTGARVRDEETDRSFDVTASRVIVCTGVWTDLVTSLGGVQAGYEVRMSKGVHLVMPRAAIDAETGIIVRTEKSVLFFIPWGERWIVGTTDTDWYGDRAEPTATGEDVDYILLAANRVLAKPLTRADVIGVYAGLRPLVATAADTPTTKLSRGHVVDVPVPGLATVAGGKFTTYRLMARDVVDAALADFPRPVAESVTAQLPLLGADGLPAVRAAAQRLAEDYDVPLTTVEHLLTRYGALVPEVLEPLGRDRSLARPLLDGYPYLRAEVAYAVTHEGALHVEDVLARRIRLLIEAPDAGVPAAAEVGAIMGGLLGWSRRRRALEVRRYLEFVDSAAEALQSAADLPEPADSVLVPA
jgi:glycerol-3-phosphate dehydrogenase